MTSALPASLILIRAPYLLLSLFLPFIKPMSWLLPFLTALLLPITAVYQHIRLKRLGLTPARLFLTLCALLHVGFIFLSRYLFGFIYEFAFPVFLICLLHCLAAYLIPIIYRVGKKRIRIALSILCPLLMLAFLALSLLMLTPTLTS